ncbi:hypothetical protein PFICI_10567 [Pestalotiopsis fici W106-1]|uniref:SGNH hydrolase-type esterase domain-containing protein n=1 Tax=Pestalotiopsis fici (strain W106-1 / CGMCC3.15140) TaxID=1229662 RepID=W3WXC8_PESFW|nr:uncharacterized protein PFICI_10567 [Pestalotiopsis fici W106-1]ETS78505.1 hypothetical protein PFICI_10567 [Pestalotiopsis fici W106-1]
MLGVSLFQSAFVAWSLLSSSAVAVPHGGYVREDLLVPNHNLTGPISPIDLHPDLLRRQAVGSVPLRILPLGASIVYGYASSDNNGFRKKLRDQLRYRGWEVNMVGSKRNGDMVDNNVEATPGDIVDQVHERSKLSYGFKPNVVLINAGTNDCTRSIDIQSIGERMSSLINDIWAADGMENTLILLSQVLKNADGTCTQNRVTINAQYNSLAQTLRSQGRPISIISMDYIDLDDLQDGTHPTDYGYVKMANVWWTAIEEAAIDGLISAAGDMDTVSSNTCDKEYGSGTYAGGLTQRGSGVGDGIYYHESEGKDVVLTISSAFDRGQWFFARLYGRGRDDLVGWFNATDGSQHYGVWKNNGDYNTAKFDKIADMTASSYCIPQGVHFIDLNADGYDDFVCINAEGNMYAGINQKDGTATTPPTFKDIGLIKATEGWAQDRVRLADIDGDGRADYCIIDDSGNVWCWRNGWVDDVPAYWQALGLRFTAKGMGDIRGVRFEDINGDGRDDWLWVSDVGQTTTWTNARSCAAGVLGDGLNVAWRQGFLKGQTSGPTHMGMADFVTDTETYLRDRIHFARIFGEPQAFGLLGKQDYVFMEHVAETSGSHTFKMRVWKNIGYGSTKLEADGNKYCNMKGYSDGRMDYVWTLSTGNMRLYPNNGLKQIIGDESFWGPVENDIWDPVTLIGKNLDRRDLHLVDWDGDGACDIVWVDPDNNNHVSLWINKYPTTSTWTWDYHADPAPALTCAQSRGLGIHDLPVRFGDISGNGRGDYLCIEKDGRVSGFVHNSDDSWENVGQIKFADGMDRANLRWSDVNGDGADDMVWIDKFTGDGTVFYNRGRGDPAELSGSSFHWEKITDPVYQGGYAGTCQYLPDLDGDGRADLHSIIGTWTNQAYTWFNRCGLTDVTGDDGPITDPGLPNPDPPTTGGDPVPDPDADDICIKGDEIGDIRGVDMSILCQFTCTFNLCPEQVCVCTEYGKQAIEELPDEIPNTSGYATGLLITNDIVSDMCAFSCQHGYCPDNICKEYVVSGGIFIVDPPTCSAPVGDSEWECTTCETDHDKLNPQYYPDEQWKSSGAADSLKDFVTWYTANRESLGASRDVLTMALASFFDYSANVNCADDTNSACTGSVACQSSDTISLAGVVILDGVFNLRSFLVAWRDALLAESVTSIGRISDFAELFTPPVEQSFADQFGQWLVDTVMGYTLGNVFDGLAGKLKLSEGLTTEAKTYWGMGQDKLMEVIDDDLSDVAETPENSEIEATMLAFFSGQRQGIADYMDFIFNGPDYPADSTPNLDELVYQLNVGVWHAGAVDTLGAIGNRSAVFMWEYLINYYWANSAYHSPVLIMSEDADDTSNPFRQIPGAQGTKLNPGQEESLSAEEAESVRFNYDGKTFWLVGGVKCQSWGAYQGQRFCTSPGNNIQVYDFMMLKGIESLTGENPDDGGWEAISTEDLVKSAWDGYKLNGNKNGYATYPNGDSDDTGTVFQYEQGIATPGLFKIPICHYDQANINNRAYNLNGRASSTLPCADYPCCTCEELGVNCDGLEDW